MTISYQLKSPMELVEVNQWFIFCTSIGKDLVVFFYWPSPAKVNKILN